MQNIHPWLKYYLFQGCWISFVVVIAATWPVLPSAGGGNLTLLLVVTPRDGVAECAAAGGPSGVGKGVVGNAESEML